MVFKKSIIFYIKKMERSGLRHNKVIIKVKVY
jgi:hypothetical protein